MPVPSRDDVIAFLESNKEQVVTLRDLIDQFDVDADARRGLRELMATLTDEGKIERIKSKLYRARQAKEGKTPPDWVVQPRPRGGERGGERGRPGPALGPNGKKLTKGGIELGIAPTQLVGVLQHIGGRATAVCSMDNEIEYLPIVEEFKGLSRDDAGVFEIIDTKHGRAAKLVQALGDPKAPRVEVLRLALGKGFRATFNAEAEAQARSFDAPGDKALTDGRRDLRALKFVTIDGEDAKDFDDAVYAERRGDGFRLWVAIADVSHYVKPGSALDRDGFHRGTSVYFPGFVLPMLPHALSDDLCSLRPNVDRLAYVAEMNVDSEGNVSDESSYKALIRSAARLTYNQVEAALNKGEQNVAHAVGEPLHVFADCSRRLRAAKAKRGAIDLDLDEPSIVLDASGQPATSVSRARLESHRLIEDAMLAANTAVARIMWRESYPSAYRVHEAPNDQKLKLLKEAAQSFGYRHPLPEAPSAPVLAKFVRALSNEERGQVLLPLVLRSMARARYSSDRLGHYALAEPDYLHFTSPIRRFPDLLVHSSMHSHGKAAPKDMQRACDWLSEREQSAERTSREVNDYYRCLLAQPLVGEEFEGTVVGVANFGAFVRIDEPYIEGLLGIRSLGDDYFALDQFGLRLVGQRSKRSLGLGDKIKVRIFDVRPAKRQIELEWIVANKSTRGERDEARQSGGWRERSRPGGRPQEARGGDRDQRRGRDGGRDGARDSRNSGRSDHPGARRDRGSADHHDRGRPSRGPDRGGRDSRGHDARGPDSRGPDSRGPDSRGPDSRGPDSRGRTSGGPDSRRRDGGDPRDDRSPHRDDRQSDRRPNTGSRGGPSGADDRWERPERFEQQDAPRGERPTRPPAPRSEPSGDGAPRNYLDRARAKFGGGPPRRDGDRPGGRSGGSRPGDGPRGRGGPSGRKGPKKR